MKHYSQYGEDLTIDELLGQPELGFYVDVGAMHPVSKSVTKLFYDRGWHGINIEPVLAFHMQLCEARPRDVNLRLLVGTPAPAVTFYQTTHSGGSTTRADMAAKLRERKLTVEQVQLVRVSLADILRQHAWGAVIDFLKVDVEGNEADVLSSNDWAQFRPRLICVERKLPFSPVSSEHTFSEILRVAGYKRVREDQANAYYMLA